MSTLRNLLIDCRIALRGAGGSGNEGLLERLEQALQGALQDGAAGSTGKSASSQQVALAWQTAARSLKVSHPDIYARLNDRVMALLDVRTLSEPTEELLRLEAQVEKLRSDARWNQQELERLEAKAETARGQLDELYQALGEAVPEIEGEPDPHRLAIRRLQQLVLRSKRTGGISVGAVSLGNSGPMPTREAATEVAAGNRKFTSEERDWTVGEALGLTGWELTPVELIEKGDAWLARLLLDKGALD